jgi:hypothetical protein
MLQSPVRKQEIALTIGMLWAATVVLILALGYSFVSLSEHGLFAVGGMLLAVAALGAIFFARRRLDARLAAERERAAQARLPQLIEQIENWHRPIAVKTNVGLPMFAGVLFTGIGLIALWHGVRKPDVEALLAALACLVIGLPVLIAFVPRIGRAALSVAAEGIELAGYGMLGWHEIDGIDLVVVRSKGAVVGHRLEFLVPDLQKRRNRMTATTRLLHALTMWGRARAVAWVFLGKSSEAPELIERLCKTLWSKATGHTHLWSRLVPEHLNEMHRQLSSQGAKLNAAFDKRDPEAVQRVLDEMKKDLDKMPGRARSRI